MLHILIELRNSLNGQCRLEYDAVNKYFTLVNYTFDEDGKESEYETTLIGSFTMENDYVIDVSDKGRLIIMEIINTELVDIFGNDHHPFDLIRVGESNNSEGLEDHEYSLRTKHEGDDCVLYIKNKTLGSESWRYTGPSSLMGKSLEFPDKGESYLNNGENLVDYDKKGSLGENELKYLLTEDKNKVLIKKDGEYNIH